MARIAPIVLVFPLVAFVGGCPTSTRNPKASMTRYKLGHDYFVKAREAKSPLQRDRYVNIALLELLKALEHDDQNHHAHLLVGLIYMHKAQVSLDEAKVSQCLTGQLLTEAKQTANKLLGEAGKHFATTKRLRGGRVADLWLNLSTVELLLGHYAKSIEAAQKALSDITYQTPWMARGNIGVALFRMKRHLRASKNLKQAVVSQRNFCRGYYWLGRTQFVQKDYAAASQSFEESIRCFRKRLKIAPVQEAFLFLGRSELQRGQTERGRKALTVCQSQASRSCVAERCRKALAEAR